MTNTTTTRQFILTFEWDEMDGFVNGRTVLRKETEQVTITAKTAVAAKNIGLRMLRNSEEGLTLRAINPA